MRAARVRICARFFAPTAAPRILSILCFVAGRTEVCLVTPNATAGIVAMVQAAVGDGQENRA